MRCGQCCEEFEEEREINVALANHKFFNLAKQQRMYRRKTDYFFYTSTRREQIIQLLVLQ